MGELDRGNRPLSPHLTIYRPQIGSGMSIFHRLTGLGLALAAVLVVWWFLAAATGADDFNRVDGVLTSWLGGLVLIVSLVALWYHFLNGIRHLVWDTGAGFELDTARKSGLAVMIGAGVLAVITLIAAF